MERTEKEPRRKKRTKKAATPAERARALRYWLHTDDFVSTALHFGRTTAVVKTWAKSDGWNEVREGIDERVDEVVAERLTDDRADVRVAKAREVSFAFWQQLQMVCLQALKQFKPAVCAGDPRGLSLLLKAAGEATEILSPLLFEGLFRSDGGSTPADDHATIARVLAMLEGELDQVPGGLVVQEEAENLEEHMPTFLRLAGGK